jgi:hypothetical protein
MYDLTIDSAKIESSKIVKDAQFAANITDETTYRNAGNLLVKIRTIRKRWKEIINPIKSKQYEAWKEACSKEKEVDQPFAQAEEIIYESMGKFYQEYEKDRKDRESRSAQDSPELPVVLPALDRINGLSPLETWSAEVDSLLELVKAVAEGRAPLVSLEANTKFLNQQAKSLKEEFNIPGCKAVKKTGYQVRLNDAI